MKSTRASVRALLAYALDHWLWALPFVLLIEIIIVIQFKGLNEEEKKFVGTYVSQRNYFRPIVLLENGRSKGSMGKRYVWSKKLRRDGKWKLVGKEVHVDNEWIIDVYRIKRTGDLNWIGFIFRGKRTLFPRGSIFIKINN